MKQAIYFEQIHPFIRYARVKQIKPHTVNLPAVAADCRMFYTVRGNCEILVDGNRYPMKRGSFLLFCSSVPYHILPNEEQTDFIIFNFDFTYAHFQKNYPIPPHKPDLFHAENALESIDFIDFEPFHKVVFLKQMESLEPDLMKIVSIGQQRRRFYRAEQSVLFEKTLLEVARNLLYDEKKEPAQCANVDQIVSYLQEHYSEKLNNTMIGKHFHFHPNYVNYLMVTHTGLSLHRYILALRITKAIEYLETSDFTVKEIAFAVGFENPSHFSRYFKQSTGRNAKEYRRTAPNSLR